MIAPCAISLIALYLDRRVGMQSSFSLHFYRQTLEPVSLSFALVLFRYHSISAKFKMIRSALNKRQQDPIITCERSPDRWQSRL